MITPSTPRLLLAVAALAGNAALASALELEVVAETDLRQPIGQLRAAPVRLVGEPAAFVVAYAADFDVDPWQQMFFYPTDTLKLALVGQDGTVRWRKDLGRGLPPGMWFAPVFPFDLDNDGQDEIWCITNPDTEHPLAIRHYRLTRLDARTGEETGSWPWPEPDSRQSLSHTFRNFILGGRVRGTPVLVTAQGTYGPMQLQGWNADMTLRWQHHIAADAPGARGSHMCPIVDFNGDGVEEVLWGERLIELDEGRERFCADRDVYAGHSDVIQPFFDRPSGTWHFFTARENHHAAKPRVVVFDRRGERVWGAVEAGHMDIGWVAHLDNPDDLVAMAVRIGHKTLGPAGRLHHAPEEFFFDAMTGEPRRLPFAAMATRPVDFDGDGVHELVRSMPHQDGAVLNARGQVLGSVGGPVALIGKLMDAPGEQVLTYHPDGRIRLWRDRAARDGERARERYAHPFYRANQALTATGSNPSNVSGL